MVSGRRRVVPSPVDADVKRQALSHWLHPAECDAGELAGGRPRIGEKLVERVPATQPKLRRAFAAGILHAEVQKMRVAPTELPGVEQAEAVARGESRQVIAGPGRPARHVVAGISGIFAADRCDNGVAELVADILRELLACKDAAIGGNGHRGLARQSAGPIARQRAADPGCAGPVAAAPPLAFGQRQDELRVLGHGGNGIGSRDRAAAAAGTVADVLDVEVGRRRRCVRRSPERARGKRQCASDCLVHVPIPSKCF